MQQISIRMNNLPLNLICAETGQIALIPTQQFKTIIDQCEGITAIIDTTGITINGESFEYNELISYKESPNMLQWLQAQKLEMPTISKNPFGFGF